MYLAIDVGTHAVRAGIIDARGTIHFLNELPLAIERLLEPARVEHNPNQICKALIEVVAVAIAGFNKAFKGQPLIAGLACQRSSVVAWDKVTGETLSPVLSWQDVRANELVRSLKNNESEIQSRSGLVLSPHYGASKIHWLQGQLAGNAVFTPLVSLLIRVLTGSGVPVCDESNAGRTQLWNLAARHWDVALAQYFKVDLNSLPSVKPTEYHYGNLNGVGAPEVNLCAVMGDQNAALLGAITPTENKVLINCGTGAFLLANRPSVAAQSKNLLNSVVCSNEDGAQFLLEGTVNGAGSSLSWFASSDEIIALGGEVWLFEQLPEWLINIRNPKGIFINAVGGLGSPYWRANLTPEFLDCGQSAEEKAVAIVESIVFLLAINFEKMSAEFSMKQEIVITGGLSRLDGLCQKLADLTGVTCFRLSQHETTLLGVGVAACAALAKGLNANSPTGLHGATLKPNRQYSAKFKVNDTSDIKVRFERFKAEMAVRAKQSK